MDMHDDLPKWEGMPAEFGGTGIALNNDGSVKK